MSLKFIDSHCHLEMLDLSLFDNNMDEVIAQAAQMNVTDLLNISVDFESFPDVLSTAKNYSNVHASVGLHPCYSPEYPNSKEQLLQLANDDKVIAIGETGLDYHMNEGVDPLSENFSWQRERFKIHIQAANECNKPLIIHTRDAKTDVIDLLQAENAEQAGGIMHCFVEDQKTADQAMEMGFYISFSGIVSFKNAKSIHQVAKNIPDEYLLIETDSPYLAPVPKRGKKNQPAYVSYVAEALAELRGVSVEHIAQVTRDNYQRCFNLSLN